MIIVKKVLFFSWCLWVLSACQSTVTIPPDWYQQPQINHPVYLITVGQGRSLEQAKQMALSQINAQLWTQIDSSFSSRDIFQSQNANTSSSSLVDNKVNSKTATVTLTGIEYPKVEKNDIAYYVQAQVSRATVIAQLQADIQHSDRQANVQISKRAHQDVLPWWLESRHLLSEINHVAVRQAMLRSLGASAPAAPQIEQLEKQVAQAQSSILIQMIASANNNKSAELLADKLSSQRLKTSFNRSSKRTHSLILTSELRQSRVGDAYISTLFTSLTLQAQNGTILASNEIISSGNSLSNYALSQEGAQRHLMELIEQQGLWSSLGFK
ncbi:LPP20 family lipoprotein [Vibrio metschnikovii]|uniref:LPP20 family lipoprotein n=1 Tax=Vibrio metschnikovii TaxID=28172 RepID=UPI001C30008C|nr:LPP20 family lipoprotein [Vibrio metschnikovii]